MQATAQGRLAAGGRWALNEKRIVERAGLDAAQGLLQAVDVEASCGVISEILALPAWR